MSGTYGKRLSHFIRRANIPIVRKNYLLVQDRARKNRSHDQMPANVDKMTKQRCFLFRLTQEWREEKIGQIDSLMRIKFLPLRANVCEN